MYSLFSGEDVMLYLRRDCHTETELRLSVPKVARWGDRRLRGELRKPAVGKRGEFRITRFARRPHRRSSQRNTLSDVKLPLDSAHHRALNLVAFPHKVHISPTHRQAVSMPIVLANILRYVPMHPHSTVLPHHHRLCLESFSGTPGWDLFMMGSSFFCSTTPNRRQIPRVVNLLPLPGFKLRVPCGLARLRPLLSPIPGTLLYNALDERFRDHDILNPVLSTVAFKIGHLSVRPSSRFSLQFTLWAMFDRVLMYTAVPLYSSRLY
ncbi:hypothetical protein EXIGLDRAFT_790962, partial [Exidia glandulosa HHB12029]